MQKWPQLFIPLQLWQTIFGLPVYLIVCKNKKQKNNNKKKKKKGSVNMFFSLSLFELLNLLYFVLGPLGAHLPHQLKAFRNGMRNFSVEEWHDTGIAAVIRLFK